MAQPNQLWNRRSFLASLAAAGAAGLTGAAPAAGADGGNQMKLGFDNFSVRAFNWKAPQLIDYAASLKVNTLLLSDLEVYESLEPGYLKEVAARARSAGVELQAGTGSLCPTSTSYDQKRWGKAEDHARLLIRTARQLGTGVARCYLGSSRDRDGQRGIYRTSSLPVGRPASPRRSWSRPNRNSIWKIASNTAATCWESDSKGAARIGWRSCSPVIYHRREPFPETAIL